MSDKLADILKLVRLPAIVDIGANPIDGDPPYKSLLELGLCSITGFEPQEDALKALQARIRFDETYLPYVIGDGEPGTLHVCQARGMTSLLKPNAATLATFNELDELGAVVETIPVETKRLNDVAEIEYLDFLKIDVQGGELAVFQNGREKLKNAIAIQTEVSFITMYENQPAIGIIDTCLRSMGFVPQCFAELKMWPIAPCVVGGNRRAPVKQLVEADIVYVKDFTRAGNMTAEQWKILALISHHCYESYDLTLRCILMATTLGALPEDAAAKYCAMLEGA